MYGYSPSASLDDSLDLETERSLTVTLISCSFHFFLSMFGVLSNFSVIIVALLEPWTEIDNFTFVMCVSLAFNRMLCSFFVFPVNGFAVATNRWKLGNMWCWTMGMSSIYFSSLYCVQVFLIILDTIVFRYSDIRKMIAVSLSKKIALVMWAVLLLPQTISITTTYPQTYPYFNSDCAGYQVTEPLEQDIPRDQYGFDPVKGGCFERFIFVDWRSLLTAAVVYIILPLISIMIYYIALLFQEEARRRLAITINKGPPDKPRVHFNSKTQIYQIAIYIVFMFPHVVLGITTFSTKSRAKPAFHELDMVWMELSSVAVPASYLITCPTYLKHMAGTVPCLARVFLRKKTKRNIRHTGRLATSPGSTSSSSATSDSVKSPAPIIRVLSPDLVEMSLSPSFQSLHPSQPDPKESNNKENAPGEADYTTAAPEPASPAISKWYIGRTKSNSMSKAGSSLTVDQFSWDDQSSTCTFSGPEYQ
ncbi:hypothetical protein ACHWQZ_G019382 [Mnemiopsis leidyi]